MPTFWFAILMLMFFAVKLGWFPVGMSAPIGIIEKDISLWDRIHHMILAQEAGVAVGSASASVVIASLAEETLKLVPLAALGLLAPGRVRRLLASDWLVLGVACGAAFTTDYEIGRASCRERV